MSATLYFRTTDHVACPACDDGLPNCRLCSNSRHVHPDMASMFEQGGVDAAWSWFDARLDEKVGAIFQTSSGRLEVWSYVLRDESEPDTYRNRRWYCAGSGVPDDLQTAARMFFGGGVLREERDHVAGRRSWAVLRAQ